MKELRISSRTKEAYTLVDDDDYNRLLTYRWWINPQGYVWTRDYTNGWRNPKNILLHRLLMSAPRNLTVDHIDRNPLNNQKVNLRLATYSEQNMNTKTRSDNTSGHRGVYWEKRRNCWRVCIHNNNKQIHIGQFKVKQDAIDAYEKRAREIYGKFI